MQRRIPNKVIRPSQARNKGMTVSPDLIDEVLEREIEVSEEHREESKGKPEYVSGFIAGLRRAKSLLSSAFNQE